MRTAKEIAAEIKKINAEGRKVNAYQNEGGRGYDHTADTSELEKEYHEAVKREFAAEWTAEKTAERRTAWNKMVKTNPPKSFVEQRKREAEMGFSLDDLKKAVAMHK